MPDAIDLLVRLNLAASLAIAAALLLRVPVRRLFGPRTAYGLWSLVPLSVAAMLVQPRVVVLERPSPDITDIAALPFSGVPAVLPPAHIAPPAELAPWLIGLWLAGAALALAALIRSQARFERAAARGRAGPAVVGVLSPRIVTPRDFDAAYSPKERRLVLAHEATHIARQDSRINALAALVRCLNWFNPLIWVMARRLRIDQEFACDAAVMARYPRSRRAYGEALLKAQLAARPLPLGCHWPPEPTHPLVARIALLTRPRDDAMGRALGAYVLTVVAVGGTAAVWAARPPRLEFSPSHEAVILARAVRLAPPLRAADGRLAPRPDPARRAGSPEPASAAYYGETPSEAAPNALPPRLSLALAHPDDTRLIPAGDIAPAQRNVRIRGAAGLSSVEPGTAVRLVASMIDPEGIELTTDLTAFGSQSLYRVGYVERNGSALKLFTRVVQHGDRFMVTAALNAGFRPGVSSSVELAGGQGGSVRLPTGEEVTLFVQPRPETAEEADASRALRGRPFVNVEQFQRRF